MWYRTVFHKVRAQSGFTDRVLPVMSHDLSSLKFLTALEQGFGRATQPTSKSSRPVRWSHSDCSSQNSGRNLIPVIQRQIHLTHDRPLKAYWPPWHTLNSPTIPHTFIWIKMWLSVRPSSKGYNFLFTDEHRCSPKRTHRDKPMKSRMCWVTPRAFGWKTSSSSPKWLGSRCHQLYIYIARECVQLLVNCNNMMYT